MFRVVRITDPNVSDSQRANYAQKYTDLRIMALKRSPHAFSTTVEIESQLDMAARINRLEESQKNIFVCINDETEEWVGQVTLIGPLSQSEYDASFQVLPGTKSYRSPSLTNVVSESYWHMTALYVDDRLRGQGLARLLCEECFAYVGKGQLRIIIKPDNTKVIEMYKRMHFHVFEGKAALLEAIHASRDGFNRLPSDAVASSVYNSRGGIVMVKMIDS